MECLRYLDLNLGISLMLETNTIMNWHSEDPESISFLRSIKLLCLICFMIHNSLFAFQSVLKLSTKDYSPNPLETQVLYKSLRYQGLLDILWGWLNNWVNHSLKKKLLVLVQLQKWGLLIQRDIWPSLLHYNCSYSNGENPQIFKQAWKIMEDAM